MKIKNLENCLTTGKYFDTSALDEAVRKLRVSTFNLQLGFLKTEKDFSDLLIQIKEERGELPEDFILLAKKKAPQYAELLKTFLIFG